MSYDITRLESDVEAALHGTTLNQIANIFGIFNRAARDILLDIDPQETKRIVEFSAPVFNGIWDYPLPTDVKGNRIVDIRPQIKRNQNDVWLQLYNQDFDVEKNGLGVSGSYQPSFTLNFNGGNKSIRVNAPNLPAGTVLNMADAINDGGTWSAGGGATNLRVDNQNFITGSGSLMFDMVAGQNSGYLENSTISPLDLTNNLNQATQFLYTYLPTATSISSIELRFGSSATDYYSVTETMTQEGTVLENAWNLLAYPWLGATVVGSPDVTKISYVRVTWNTDSTAQTALRLNGIQSIIGRVLEIEYYSKFFFRDAITGAFKEMVTSVTDLINLDVESYQIYFNRVMYLITQQLQGIDAMFHDGPFFQEEYEKQVARYQALYKSEVQKPHTTYYRLARPGYSQYFGGRWFGG
jgi:hypothetical protein